MLKINKIKVSGFRGIPILKELDFLEGSKEPRSFVLYGPNSSGKTSFVDGIEWFLDRDSKIQWLQREAAREQAYPHQEAKSGDSFVEIEFYRPKNTIGALTKHYDNKSKTQPTESDKVGFEEIYKTFVIPPYLRYMDVIDFVYQKTAKEKYERLSEWMGFEDEVEFQEKISIDVPRALNEHEKQLIQSVRFSEDQIKRITGQDIVIEDTIINFCNKILAEHKISPCKKVSELPDKIAEASKLKSVSVTTIEIEKLNKAKISISSSTAQKNIGSELEKLGGKIKEFRKEEQHAQQIDVIELYTKALELLNKQTGEKAKCPVCGLEWEKEKLAEHIQKELGLLTKVKEDKGEIDRLTTSLKAVLSREVISTEGLIGQYNGVKEIIAGIEYENTKKYLEIIKQKQANLADVLKVSDEDFILEKTNLEKLNKEREEIILAIDGHIAKIQLSASESKLIENIGKLNQVKEVWASYLEAKKIQEFTSNRIQDFLKLKDELVKAIQKEVKDRFDSVSGSIGKYFGILRRDKDIKDIKIKLNEEKGRAAGRSAEIELSYYGISVEPAYKVLSESLLNSLGLAVYFTCVKHFNKECKFIVLDDIMNSLDIEKRDTLLNLIRDEFLDYQIILFTHDEHWFEKIGRRFPKWIRKKIKSSDYATGPKIDPVLTTKEEIDEYLKDSTKIKEAGRLLGEHVDTILNELCEGLLAEVRHRYIKNVPLTIEDLFGALYKRLKEELKTHSIIKQADEVRKYVPQIRNFVSHVGTFSTSKEEVQEAAEKWFALESEFYCPECSELVEYQQNKKVIECYCGKKKLIKPKVSK